jgi:hypothetical protein
VLMEDIRIVPGLFEEGNHVWIQYRIASGEYINDGIATNKL